MNKAKFLTALNNSGFDLEKLFSLHNSVKGTIYATEMRPLFEWYGKLTGWEHVLLNLGNVRELIGFSVSVANIYRLQIPNKKYRRLLKEYSGKEVFIYMIQGTGGNFSSYYALIKEVASFEDASFVKRLTALALYKNRADF